MNAPTEKDHIDAKLQAVIEKMNGDITAHQLKTNARLDKLEETVAHGLQTLDFRMTRAEANFQHELHLLGEEFNAKLAQMESNFHRSQMDVLKWTIGSMGALTAVSVTVTSILFVNLSHKEEQQPQSQQHLDPAHFNHASITTLPARASPAP